MVKTEFEIEFHLKNDSDEGYPVIIVAAGSSSRMKGVDKLFASLCGIPVLVRTLRAFENCSNISEITVVTAEDKLADVKKLAERYAVGKLKNIIVGGSCREASVKNGVELYKGKSDKVLIHDGARPLVSADVIKNVVLVLKQHDSVTCAVPIKDTVKITDESGKVAKTPNRNNMVAVQTPQGVNTDIFLNECSRSDISKFTDDTSVMEAAGVETVTVNGDYRNIKITTQEDLIVAEAYLETEL